MGSLYPEMPREAARMVAKNFILNVFVGLVDFSLSVELGC